MQTKIIAIGLILGLIGFIGIQQAQLADAAQKQKATAEQINVLCEIMDNAYEVIARYHEPHPPKAVDCKKVAAAG